MINAIQFGRIITENKSQKVKRRPGKNLVVDRPSQSGIVQEIRLDGLHAALYDLRTKIPNATNRSYTNTIALIKRLVGADFLNEFKRLRRERKATLAIQQSKAAA